MRYSNNMTEKMHQIGLQLPKRSFPPGVLPGYVPFMTDDEIDQWVDEQWGSYRGTQRRKPIKYTPRILDVAEERVTDILSEVGEAKSFWIFNEQGRYSRVTKVGRHMWSVLLAYHHGEPCVIYSLTATIRFLLEHGYCNVSYVEVTTNGR